MQSETANDQASSPTIANIEVNNRGYRQDSFSRHVVDDCTEILVSDSNLIVGHIKVFVIHNHTRHSSQAFQMDYEPVLDQDDIETRQTRDILETELTKVQK